MPSAHVAQLIEKFVELAGSERLLCMSEGLVKIRLIEAALALGWTVQEGTGSSQSQSMADFGAEIDGTIRWTRGPRRAKQLFGSSDACIVNPFVAFAEIKARPDAGTKSQAQFREMLVDVRRAAGDRQTMFWFVFDEKAYRSFSGEKLETRGRKSKDNEWFNVSFLEHETIKNIGDITKEVLFEGEPMILHFSAIRNVSPPFPVLVVGYRSDARFVGV